MTSPTIEHEGPRSMVASSGTLYTNEQVIGMVESQMGEGWYLPAEWVNVIDGAEVVKSNPFQRDGKYVWLLRKD